MGKIHLEGADNARDLGGLKTTEGAVIREKKLIRSNRLSKLTQNDMNLLSNEYHLHKILDLRTPMEVEQEADRSKLYEYSIFYGKYGWGKP